MNRLQRNRCLEITEKLIKHPAAKLFIHPIDSSAPNMSNYYSIIDDPQDLSTIKSRLRHQKYRSVREWKRDINTIWNNAMIFSGVNSFPYVMAKHLSNVFEKELKIMSATNLIGWLNLVTDLKTQLNNLIESPPEFIKESAPLEMLKHEKLKPFLPDDYLSFMRDYKALEKTDDQKEICRILGIDRLENEMELTKLSLLVLQKAKCFLKEKLPDKRRSLMNIKVN